MFSLLLFKTSLQHILLILPHTSFTWECDESAHEQINSLHDHKSADGL